MYSSTGKSRISRPLAAASLQIQRPANQHVGAQRNRDTGLTDETALVYVRSLPHGEDAL
jgi:hypothetical protein